MSDTKPYLRQAAEYFYGKKDISHSCLIFPNRRSMVFFQNYFCDLVRNDKQAEPMRMPQMYTVNDFFYHIYDMEVTDKVSLLLTLYDCYCKLVKNPEPLDEFVFWGDVILSDFDDVDKYLIDPEKLFRNVAEFKGMEDDFSYLTETQKTAIRNFLGHFKTEGDIKSRFLKIWDILLPLYNDFNSVLKEQGDAYEGMVYRSLAKPLRDRTVSVADILGKAFPRVNFYGFIGLNVLNECERTVMLRMKEAGIAEFSWDYSGNMIKDPHNRSSLFMSRNVETFPQAFTPDPDGLVDPVFNVVSVPSSVGQVKMLPTILGKFGQENDTTAIILPDESLLSELLNTIPDSIADVNVTMGYPMSGSAIYALVNSALQLQMTARQRADGIYFHHAHVKTILSNTVFRKAASVQDGGSSYLMITEKIKADGLYYIPEENLKGNDLFEAVFHKAEVGDCDYLNDIISSVAPKLGTADTMKFEAEFAKKLYSSVSMLKSKKLDILPATFIRLLQQLCSSMTVPFHGEPLVGLQVMGPLETRALDFDNMVILSANDGVFPRRSISSSFIPPELRKGFELPTYELQDAVWAYYFYRMICRAKNVWMLYDSRTEGVRSGEESRYIKQLEYHFGKPVNRFYTSSKAGAVPVEPDIQKTQAHVDIIRKASLSASAIKNYLDCKVKFYYQTVEGLRPEEDVVADLDAGMLGNVFHHTMQALYLGPEAMNPDFEMTDVNIGSIPHLKEIDRNYLKGWLKDQKGIKARVRTLIKAELKAQEVAGRNLVVEDVICKYVNKTLQRDLELLENKNLASFEVLGLEKKCSMDYQGFHFIGYIDRLDRFGNEVRVLDYKTGKVEAADENITDANAEAIVKKLFGESNSGRPKIAFQIFLYDMFMKKEGYDSLVNVIYSPSNLFKEAPREVPMSEKFYELTEKSFVGLLAELSSVDVPFTRTTEPKTCEYCDFKTICGR
ncbi:MAG: PD-(D/E)XK nuclease family protein [Bacteroidales bacterium]|nr:PD-(D/E)XK nuclease family protein [Bacteroidales bacterium]